MEAKKKQYYSNNRTSYIEGNTVRKLNAVPERRREERPTEAPRPRRQVQRQPRGLSNMNFASLVVLVAAIVATLYMCVNFLQLQTEVSRMEKSIKTYETSLKNLTNENDAAYAAINQAYDLNYVYKIAVEELGMVYPNNNEVITYEGSDLEYVRQYEDIPD
ncbi:MAG: putative rane protein [Herbinix sp.]|jgi:cell division protein FtsL|nr:putative rane protein [Herbinix sp.]